MIHIESTPATFSFSFYLSLIPVAINFSITENHLIPSMRCAIISFQINFDML